MYKCLSNCFDKTIKYELVFHILYSIDKLNKFFDLN